MIPADEQAIEALIAKWRSEASGYRLRDDDAQDECGVLISRCAGELEQALGERRQPAQDADLAGLIKDRIISLRRRADVHDKLATGHSIALTMEHIAWREALRVAAIELESDLKALVERRSRPEAAK